MKNFLPLLSIALLMAACNSKADNADVKTLQNTQQNSTLDTAGLSQFQQWKARNELSASNVQPQVSQPAPAAATVQVIREVRVIERPAPVRKRLASPKTQPVPAPVENSQVENGNGDVANTGDSPAEGAGTTTSGSEETAKKEGWSKAAKGTAIGGASGAVIGAVINKRNPAVGAVIGGVLGGAVGYGVGKAKDKKDGRN
ncbi:MAG TPA: YMGG-like glycine zipper-containing protein [Flavisolibacter sp.]|nr:YMGG-like glycine zipper-containing protein [Flavisolibacter sp.]